MLEQMLKKKATRTLILKDEEEDLEGEAGIDDIDIEETIRCRQLLKVDLSLMMKEEVQDALKACLWIMLLQLGRSKTS